MSQATPALYSFLPWLRRGMSIIIQNPDNDAGDGAPGGANNNPQRVQTKIKLKVVADKSGEHDDISTDMALYGPGDIVSIDPNIIIRTEPVDKTADFEPNYLASVEFAEPDFPWRYTPAAPASNKQTLRPWIFLIVLQDDGTEYDRVHVNPSRPLPWINVKDISKLPNSDQIWAWAHVQLLNKLDGQVQDELAARPHHFISRLVCPRRLLPNRSYVAFLVPSFETGRLAGLGDIEALKNVANGLQRAWPANGNNAHDIPFYFSFRFSTGQPGDFESLVRKLEPRQMPEGVGIRDIDVSAPGYNLQSASSTGQLGLEGALMTPSTKPTQWNDQSAENFKESLKEILNAAGDAIIAENAEQPPEHSPKVTPPIYGCWHARIGRVNASEMSKWINDLNLDPRNRAAGGIGTTVIRSEQDKLMASAWKQVAEIERINQKLRQAQLAAETSKKHFEKLKGLPVQDFLQFTSPVHAKIIERTFSKTVLHQFRDSVVIPDTALSSSLRQIARPRGPVRQRQAKVIAPESASGEFFSSWKILGRLGREEITASPKRVQPDKIAQADIISDALALEPTQSTSANVDKDELRLSKFTPDAVRSTRIRRNFALTQPWSRPVAGEKSRFAVKDEGVRETDIDRTPLSTTDGFPGEVPTHTTTTTPLPPPGPSARDEIIGFRDAAANLLEKLAAIPDKEIKETIKATPVDLTQISSNVSNALEPYVNLAASLKARLKVSRPSIIKWDPQEPIEPILAHPTFPQPMYEALRDISQEFLLPGLDKIPPNTISLLLSNQRFIESYMVGLNHEMSRELLWREYPTDRRGTYFRQFWDVRGYIPEDSGLSLPEETKDIQEIHTWKSRSELGTHSPRQQQQQHLLSSSDKKSVILLIRGDLFRRYPNSVVYAVRAVKDDTPQSLFTRKLASPEEPPDRLDPLFRGTLYPDVTFFGFNLTEEEARGNTSSPYGWYFIIQEQPGEPRFGLDAEDLTKPFGQQIASWNDLSWNSIVKTKEDLDATINIDLDKNQPSTSPTIDVAWKENSSNTGYILLQRRTRIAIHAQDMLPPPRQDGGA